MITDPSSTSSLGNLPHYRTVCSDVIEQLPNQPIYCLTSTYGMDDNATKSYLAWDPVITFSSLSDGTSVITQDGVSTKLSGDPLSSLQSLLDRFSGLSSPPLCIGLFSYDLRTTIERFESPLSDDLGTPLIHMGIFDTHWEIDHTKRTSRVVTSDISDTRPSGAEGAREFTATLEAAIKRISPSSPMDTPLADSVIPEGFLSQFSREQYVATVKKAQEHIRAGDIYQVNLSQRFSGPLSVPARSMFRALMHSTPSPFAAYMELPGMTILSSSPERFLKVEDGIAETRPIKGTRPRGASESEDASLKNELINSQKDRAENVMIVDVERNDLGRVCEIGSIDASTLLRVETYPQVHHLVSVVTGTLPDNAKVSDVLRATFPGGSISGAPKIRAMQIIDDLEKVGRGAYTGSIGRLGSNGDLDLNILIRTLIMKDGQAHLSVGGGIVADSDPESEYEETLHKAAGVFAAIERARQWS